MDVITAPIVSRMKRRAFHERGQILPLTLSGVVLAAAIMLMLANIGNKITEKSVVVDAADAAAMSGATWVAQHLNFMAYTNRAMIANHVGVGHFVAYMSWIRYVDDAADKIQDILQFIPFANAASEVLEQFADILRELAEFEGEIFVPAVDELNQFYQAAQKEAHETLGIPNTVNIPVVGQPVNGIINAFLDSPMDKLMQASGESFDSEIKVNSFSEIAKIDASMSVPLLTLLSLQNPRIEFFITPREVTDRGGALVRLVEATYGNDVEGDGFFNQAANFFQPKGSMSSDWLLDRQENIGGTLNPIEKEFDTKHTLNDDLATWEAEDKLVVKPLFGKGGDITLAEGKATAAEFDDNYEGIPGWYDLTIPVPGHQFLPIIAYASKPQSTAAPSSAFELGANDQPLSALSIAYVEHRRPDEGFDPLIALPVPIPFLDDVEANGEFANLFNPFWRARIVGTHFSDLKKANPLINLIDGVF